MSETLKNKETSRAELPIFKNKINERDNIIESHDKNRPGFYDLINNYGEKRIKRDKITLKKILEQEKKSEEDEKGVSDPMLLERTFFYYAGKDAWFDRKASNEEGGSKREKFFPTSDYDDHVNHVDVVGAVKNELTDEKIVPFAVDLTCRTDDKDGKLSQKFRWHHKALRIKGFAQLDYFKDKSSPDNPMLPLGHVDIMPRFVVGYSVTTARNLMGKPKDNYKEIIRNSNLVKAKKDEQEEFYDEKMEDFVSASWHARWASTIEIMHQIRGIKKSLNRVATESANAPMLEKAKNQLDALNKFFKHALKETAKDYLVAQNGIGCDTSEKSIEKTIDEMSNSLYTSDPVFQNNIETCNTIYNMSPLDGKAENYLESREEKKERGGKTYDIVKLPTKK